MDTSIELAGFYNLREGGGMPVAGGHVRTRRLLRADFPHSFESETVRFFEELPLRAVVDLRTQEEVVSRPRYFADLGFEVNEVPIQVGSAASMLRSIPTVAELSRLIVANAPQQVTYGVAAVAAAVPEGATLVHCTAGKDRTGVVIALVLDLLGVDDADIVANYVLTQTNLEGVGRARLEARLKQMAGGPPMPANLDVEAVMTLSTASPAEAIQGVLKTIRDEHGSVERFLLEYGLAPHDIETLRAELIAR